MGTPVSRSLHGAAFPQLFARRSVFIFRPSLRVACASIRRAFDTVGVVHQPLEVFDERPFVVVAESGFFLEGARAEIVAAIHNQIRALAELKK